jgi:hypothetical protein
MNTKVLVAAGLAFAMATSLPAATASSGASKQRVRIQSTESHTAFVLVPVKPGALLRDSGSAIWSTPSERVVVRGGQRIEVDEVTVMFSGARGSLNARFRIEWSDAGHGYAIGAGRWTVVRGTGVYARFRGGGLSASVWPAGGEVMWRAEGLLGSS